MDTDTAGMGKREDVLELPLTFDAVFVGWLCPGVRLNKNVVIFQVDGYAILLSPIERLRSN